MTYAKIIADSVTVAGHRVTTMEVRCHRFVLAEFNTHRVFSRNSASSRAIPLGKQLDRVTEEPAIPVSWPLEQKGMQGGEEAGPLARYGAEGTWLEARDHAVQCAQKLGGLGIHKSIANRLLEPFMWHTIVVTATAWENFFGLRCNPMAQPEIRVAAHEMRLAMETSEPKLLDTGQWHLPYIDKEDWKAAEYNTATVVKMSAARCARVSYLTQDGKRDPQADVDLYDRLTSASPMHASPLEHVAKPAPTNVHSVFIPTGTNDFGAQVGYSIMVPQYGNLLGWHQLRFDVEGASNYQAYR